MKNRTSASGVAPRGRSAVGAKVAGNRQFTRQPRRRFSYTVAESEASIMISRLRASTVRRPPLAHSNQPLPKTELSKLPTGIGAGGGRRRGIRCETRLLPRWVCSRLSPRLSFDTVPNPVSALTPSSPQPPAIPNGLRPYGSHTGCHVRQRPLRGRSLIHLVVSSESRLHGFVYSDPVDATP